MCMVLCASWLQAPQLRQLPGGSGGQIGHPPAPWLVGCPPCIAMVLQCHYPTLATPGPPPSPGKAGTGLCCAGPSYQTAASAGGHKPYSPCMHELGINTNTMDPHARFSPQLLAMSLAPIQLSSYL